VTIGDLGSIGELVAAIATLATLVYLAVQIRANTAAMKAEGSRANRAAGIPMHVAIVQDGDLARIFNAGLANFSSLNPEERTRFAFLLGDLIANAANMYEDVKLGIISEAEFESTRDIIAPYFAAPGGRAKLGTIQRALPGAVP